MIIDFQRQTQALISLCTRILGCFPIARTDLRLNVFKILNKIVKNSTIGKQNSPNFYKK